MGSDTREGLHAGLGRRDEFGGDIGEEENVCGRQLAIFGDALVTSCFFLVSDGGVVVGCEHGG